MKMQAEKPAAKTTQKERLQSSGGAVTEALRDGSTLRRAAEKAKGLTIQPSLAEKSAPGPNAGQAQHRAGRGCVGMAAVCRAKCSGVVTYWSLG